MDVKVSIIRVIIMSLLLFLFLSSATVVAEPALGIKKNSGWRATIFHTKHMRGFVPREHENPRGDIGH
ncbi:hypothetical protein ACB094_12G090900 [Castanea mollissima]